MSKPLCKPLFRTDPLKKPRHVVFAVVALVLTLAPAVHSFGLSHETLEAAPPSRHWMSVQQDLQGECLSDLCGTMSPANADGSRPPAAV